MSITQMVLWERTKQRGDCRLTPLQVPLPLAPPFDTGRWSVGWVGIVGNGDADRLALLWEGVAEGQPPLTLSVRVEAGDGKVLALSKCSGVLPSNGCLRSEVLTSPACVYFFVEVGAEAKPPPPEEKISGHFAALTAGPSIQNVVLSFIRSGRQIWTSEALLRESPYFETLFSSGFAETSADGPKAEEHVDERVDEPVSFEDSDDETDAALPKPSLTTLSASSFPGVKTIRITEASYSTYLAVICWMQCDYISFAPLKSTFRPSSSSSVNESTSPSAQRLEAILPSSRSSTPFPPPPPVSPKSVYRLAHFLSLPALSTLALSSFTSQLTPLTVASELFSPTSCCYEPILDACLDFVVKNVKAVFESEGMRAAEERARAGEMGGQEGAVWARLAGRVARGSGDWKAGWISVDGGKDVLGFAWTGVTGQYRVERLTFRVEDRGKVCWRKDLHDVVFPPQPDGRLLTSAVTPKYSEMQTTNNVLLDFPRSGRQIWTTEDLLRDSPYFASLFSSDFSESIATTSSPSSDAAPQALPYDDSDDEEKASDDKRPRNASSASSSPNMTLPHKTVTVTEASYYTYLAVVCWMKTGEIAFAGLSSSSFFAAAVGSSSTAKATSSLRPVSPKSVYRLSHLLSLPALSTLALSNFSSSLTVQNAARELFSETSGCYPDVRDAVIDLIVKHVQGVFATPALREAEERAADGTDAEWEGAVWAKLAGALGRKG
ncbi:hypothetical protein JCM6882_003316 [Rhodosporidiobolus microsporus]